MSVPLLTLLGGRFGRDGHVRGAGSRAILRREILAVERRAAKYQPGRIRGQGGARGSS
jgi:hypothetical protein